MDLRPAILLTVVALCASACLRSTSTCRNAADCFSNERCADGVCELLPVSIPPTPPPDGEIALDQNPSLSAMEFFVNARGWPELMVRDDNEFRHVRWDGFQWVETTLQTPGLGDFSVLELAKGDTLAFTYTDRDLNLHLVTPGGDELSDTVIVPADEENAWGASLVQGEDRIDVCYLYGDMFGVLDGAVDSGQPYYGVMRDGEFRSEPIALPESSEVVLGCTLLRQQVSWVFMENDAWSDIGNIYLGSSLIVDGAFDTDFGLGDGPRIDGRVVESGAAAFDRAGSPAFLHARLSSIHDELFLTRNTGPSWKSSRIATTESGRFFIAGNIAFDPNSDTSRAWVSLRSIGLDGTNQSVSIVEVDDHQIRSVDLKPLGEVDVIRIASGPEGLHLVYGVDGSDSPHYLSPESADAL